jgi:hypothetical protein
MHPFYPHLQERFDSERWRASGSCGWEQVAQCMGKLMHMVKWSRHVILNRAQKLSRLMAIHTIQQLKMMNLVMKYLRGTMKIDSYSKPSFIWDGVVRPQSSSYRNGEIRRTHRFQIPVVASLVELCFYSSRLFLSSLACRSVSRFRSRRRSLSPVWKWCRTCCLRADGTHCEVPMVVKVDTRGAGDIAAPDTLPPGSIFCKDTRSRVLSRCNGSEDCACPRTFLRTAYEANNFRHRDIYVRENSSVHCVEATTTTVPVGEGVKVRVHPRDTGGEQK